MNIKYKTYTLKQCGDRFDLYETVTRTKKESSETYTAEKEIGYGFILENALKRVVMEELSKDSSIVDLNTFLERYKEEFNQLKKVINEV